MPRTAMLAGPTGLVGSHVLSLLLEGERYARVIAWTRGATGTKHPKLEEWQGGADMKNALRDTAVDDVFCCLGTTMRKAGSREAFVHVDKELVLLLGAFAKHNGARSFGLVSAIGADPRSRIFYNRVKGEVEVELKAMELPALHIFQPSILDGQRRESRPGERIGLVMARMLAPVLPARYRPMPADMLARAMVNAAAAGATGIHVHTGRSIAALA